MLNNYKLDLKDKKILNELDNLCGVSQNKDILRVCAKIFIKYGYY